MGWLLSAIGIAAAVGSLPDGDGWDSLKGFLSGGFVIAGLMTGLFLIGMFVRFVRENRTLKRIRRKVGGHFRRARPSENDETDDYEVTVGSRQDL